MATVVYADTSFWVSLYVADANSKRARFLVLDNHPIFMTRVVEHELRNAIRLGIFRKQITSAQGRASLAAFESDRETELIETVDLVWRSVFDRADDLSGRFTARQGQRATDVLHVASALELGATKFLTFDDRQSRLAKSAGLKLVQ